MAAAPARPAVAAAPAATPAGHPLAAALASAQQRSMDVLNNGWLDGAQLRAVLVALSGVTATASAAADGAARSRELSRREAEWAKGPLRAREQELHGCERRGDSELEEADDGRPASDAPSGRHRRRHGLSWGRRRRRGRRAR